MTDIVERLRAIAQNAPGWPERGFLLEAAAEVERLRADNEHLRTTLGYLADNIDNPALVAVAEAALVPKP